jgi:hypothetical protein
LDGEKYKVMHVYKNEFYSQLRYATSKLRIIKQMQFDTYDFAFKFLNNQKQVNICTSPPILNTNQLIQTKLNFKELTFWFV